MPDLSATDVLSQAYQGMANTVGPYFNISSIFQPAYGQTALGNQQQQMFGYNVGPGGSIGTPYTPYGGWVGGPQPTQASPYGAPAPAYGPAAPAGQPGATPTGMTLGGAGATPIGGAPVSSAPGGTQIYSPPQDTRIGFGQTFNNPYAGQFGPAQDPGYHPGTLSLNTTALGAFGPAATQGLLQANPYLANALNFQTLAEADASNPLQNSQILNTLNQQSQNQLAAGGHLTPEQERANSQAALSAFSNAGAGTTGNQAIAAQLFGRQNMIDQRLAAAQQLAQNVQGLNFTQQGQELQRQGLAGSLATQAAGTATSALTNPLLQILGLGSLNSTSSPSGAISDQNSLQNPYMNVGTSLANTLYNQQQAQDIASQNQQAAQTSGLISAGGSILGGLLSDERLKKDVKKVGKSESGIPEFEWVYKYDPYKKRYHGTTAQALEKVRPEAVITDPTSGIKLVDYAKTDVSFHQLNPYLKKAA